MSPIDDPTPDPAAEDDRLRHALVTPLTVISGRAQLLTRLALRSPSLTEPERLALLDGLTTITDAVRLLVRRIDALKEPRPVSHGSATAEATNPTWQEDAGP